VTFSEFLSIDSLCSPEVWRQSHSVPSFSFCKKFPTEDTETALPKSETATRLGITFHDFVLAVTNPNWANCFACRIAICRVRVMRGCMAWRLMMRPESDHFLNTYTSLTRRGFTTDINDKSTATAQLLSLQGIFFSRVSMQCSVFASL